MRQVTIAFSPIANEDISSRMRPVVLLRWVDVYLVLVVALYSPAEKWSSPPCTVSSSFLLFVVLVFP
jgi:hypothetical protein